MNRVRVAAGFAAALCTVVTLASCGSGVRFVRQDMTEYPPKPSNAPVEIHEGGTATPHVVIGTFTAERTMKASYGDGSNVDLVMDDLRKAARKVGADALVHVHPILTEKNMTKPRIEIVATAVRYLKETNSVQSGEGSR